MVETAVYKHQTQNISVLIITSTEPTGCPPPTPTPIPGDAQAGSAGDPPRAPLGKMKCSLSRLSTVAQVGRNNLRWSL